MNHQATPAAAELLATASLLISNASPSLDSDYSPQEWGTAAEQWRQRYHTYLEDTAGADADPEPAAGAADGQWMEISFMGHRELVGYVTERTLNGQLGYHIDLPDKVWGDNPLAWEEYAAASLYSRRPVTAESVRKRWEADRERAAARRRQLAEWEQQRALSAAGDGAGEGDTGAGQEPF